MSEQRRLGSTSVHPGATFANDHPALERAWHPVALAADVTDGAVEVELLGRRWVLRRQGRDGTMRAEPDPDGRVREHLGLVWLAPAPVAEPVAELITCPQFDDPVFASAWLVPARTTAAASLLADNFLDIAHFPFVHAGTFGSAEDAAVPPYDVEVVSDVEFSYSYTHGYLNDEDPGVAAGLRPRHQVRRVACRYRLPFQMVLTLEHVESGGTTVVLFFLQPEHRRSTIAYTCVLRDHMGGAPVDLAAAVAFEHAVLMEDLALQEQIDLAGLPLEARAEVHVRADRAGLELRRALRHLLRSPATQAAAGPSSAGASSLASATLVDYVSDDRMAMVGWQPVAPANADRTRPHRVDVAGRPYALVHLAGDWVLVSDRCPHRFAPLSAGTIVGEPGEERLQCAYHGWQFDGDGRCRLVPSLGPEATAPPRAATAEAGPVVERDGTLWACFDPTAAAG